MTLERDSAKQNTIAIFDRSRERLRLERNCGSYIAHSPAQVGTRRAGCPGPWPGKSLEITKYAISLLCCKGTLMAHIQFGIHLDSQGISCKATSHLSGLTCTGAWDCTAQKLQDFPLPELQEVPVSQLLQPTEGPLDGSMTLWSIRHASQFCVI